MSRAQLTLALYKTGRQADALQVFRDGSVDPAARLVPGIKNHDRGGVAGYQHALADAAVQEQLSTADLGFPVTSHLLRKSCATDLAWATGITAMAAPAAAGKRYLLLADGPTITWLGLAQILRDHLGPAGKHVTIDEAPGEDPLPLTIHNDRAKQELDWQPRPAETTIVETADSLYELGLLGDR
jgi:hypothetical protein